MSVTFFIDTTDVDVESAPATVTCCPDARVLHFPTLRLAQAWCAMRNTLDTPFALDGCTDVDLCTAYPMHAHSVVMDALPSVNMSNIRARDVLDALGYGGEPECIGSADAEAFLGRVLLADAIAPYDDGMPVSVTRHEGGPTVVECPREPGYLQHRLADLHDVAEVARARGARVCWG